jgi:hypothetical protein
MRGRDPDDEGETEAECAGPDGVAGSNAHALLR